MNSGLFIIGFIFILLGFFALGLFVNQDKYYFFDSTRGGQRPYSYLGYPLLGIGTILMIAGAAVPDTAPINVPKSEIYQDSNQNIKKTRYVEVKND